MPGVSPHRVRSEVPPSLLARTDEVIDDVA
jgi:hypothetical protein